MSEDDFTSFGPTSTRRVPCHACEKKTRVDTLFEQIVRWEDSRSDIEGVEEHYVFQCRGCETVFQCISRSNSENYFTYVDDHGKYETEHPWDTEYLPRIDKRMFDKLPALPIEFIAPEVNKILRETYGAAEAGFFTLAASGLRTTFDTVTEVLGIDSEISFHEKLEALRKMGKIGGEEKGVLEVLVDAGSAAVHRGWHPTEGDLVTLIDTMNNFIYSQLIRPKEIKELKGNVPSKTTFKAT